MVVFKFSQGISSFLGQTGSRVVQMMDVDLDIIGYGIEEFAGVTIDFPHVSIRIVQQIGVLEIEVVS